MKFTNNPCEKHLEVSIGKTEGFCPICLMDERDKLQEQLEHTLEVVSGLLHIIDEHGNIIQRGHATTLLEARKALGWGKPTWHLFR